MDPQLKQRLVGVAVIFLLAIIFVPMLLDGAGTPPQHLQVEIPEKPVIEPYQMLEPKVIELKRQAAAVPKLEPRIVDEISDPPDTASVPAEPVTEKAPPQAVVNAPEKVAGKAVTSGKPDEKVVSKVPTAEPVKTETAKSSTAAPVASVKKRPAGETWIVQAGSFNDKAKAYRLRDRIRKSRLASDVFIEKFSHGGTLSYRVRLGMFLSRKQARIVANKLYAKFKIKGLVQRYDK